MTDEHGAHPIAQGRMPPLARALIEPLKQYERLTVEAAVTGSYDAALRALIAHPLVGSYGLAKGILDDYRAQRRELGERHKAIDLEHNRYKLLAELLGRDRLQRFLVRKAEKQIVDYANAVLDRLSSGQLFLKLVGTDEGSTEKALELECANRTAGTAAIN